MVETRLAVGSICVGENVWWKQNIYPTKKFGQTSSGMGWLNILTLLNQQILYNNIRTFSWVFIQYSVLTSKYGWVVTYQKLKTIEKFKSPALKVVALAYERSWLARGLAYSNFTVRRNFEFWKSGCVDVNTYERSRLCSKKNFREGSQPCQLSRLVAQNN